MLLKKSLTKFLITSVAIIALLILSGVAFAQTDTGKISGFVKDQNGAIVPGANITVTNQRNGDERSAKANDDGFYSVPALKASSYRIIAETTGLSAKIENVNLNVGQELTVNLAVAVGEVQQAALERPPAVAGHPEQLARRAVEAVGDPAHRLLHGRVGRVGDVVVAPQVAVTDSEK